MAQLHSFKFYSILLIVLGFCPFSNRIEKNEVEAVPPYNDALWYLFKWCIIINPRISQATEGPLLTPPSKTNQCCANQGSVSFLARPLVARILQLSRNPSILAHIIDDWQWKTGVSLHHFLNKQRAQRECQRPRHKAGQVGSIVYSSHHTSQLRIGLTLTHAVASTVLLRPSKDGRAPCHSATCYAGCPSSGWPFLRRLREMESRKRRNCARKADRRYVNVRGSCVGEVLLFDR